MYVRVNSVTAKQKQEEKKIGNINFLYCESGSKYFLKMDSSKLKIHIIKLMATTKMCVCMKWYN